MKLLALLLGGALLVIAANLGTPIIDDIITVYATVTSSCTDALRMSSHIISSTVSPVQSTYITHTQSASTICSGGTASVTVVSTITPIVTVHASSLISADSGHASTTTMYTTITPATTLTSERPSTTTTIVHDTVTTNLTLLRTASATSSPMCDAPTCLSGLTPAVHTRTCLRDRFCSGTEVSTQVSAQATSTMTVRPPFYNFTNIGPHATNFVGSSKSHNTTWSAMSSYPIPLVSGTNSTSVAATTSNLPTLPSLVTQTSVIVVTPTSSAATSGPSVSIPLPLTRASSSTSTATTTAVSGVGSTRQIPRIFLLLSQLVKTLQAEAQIPTSTVTEEHTSTTTIHPSTVTITASTPAQTSVANVFTSCGLVLFGFGLSYVWLYL